MTRSQGVADPVASVPSGPGGTTMTARARVIARRAAFAAAWGLAIPLVWIPAPATADSAPGTVWEWGSNDFGQLGNGSTSTSPSNPAAVAGLSDVVSVHGGREHVIVLTASGQVLTWGSNQVGALGGRPRLGAPRWG